MVRLCAYILFFAVSVAVVIGYDCENGAVGCRTYSNYLRCYINSSNTQLIKSQIKLCSAASGNYSRLYLYKRYNSEDIGNLIVEIDLPSNIKELYLFSYYYSAHDYIRLTTSKYNYALTYMYIEEKVKIESPNFFNYFSELKKIRACTYYYYYYYHSNSTCDNIINSEQTPSFTNLQKLTSLTGRFYISNTATLDATMLSGLGNLVYLSLADSNFERIEQNAFQNLKQLTFLNLKGNKITSIEDGTFNSLKKLKELHLDGNGIETANSNIFEGLDELKTLSISQNPNFPLDTISKIKNLTILYINYNDYTNLDPFVFQQLKKLEYLEADNNPFTCDCRLQWANIISRSGIYISGNCLEPWNARDISITTSLLYANCTQMQSYKCFNKSISCPNNKVCYNTKDSYTCGCPKGYSLYNSGECNDIDECSVSQKCEHGCENTEGSYICTCQDGFKLSSDGYTCEDVNEGQDSNSFVISISNILPTSIIINVIQTIIIIILIISTCFLAKNKFIKATKQDKSIHVSNPTDFERYDINYVSSHKEVSTSPPIKDAEKVGKFQILSQPVPRTENSRNGSPNSIDSTRQYSSRKDGQQEYYYLDEISKMKNLEKGKYRNLPSPPSSPEKLGLYEIMS